MMKLFTACVARRLAVLGLPAAALLLATAPALATLPETYDLRSDGDYCYVTPVKNQAGGTC